MRNICKNFANFGLLGILLRQIIQYITNKSGDIQSIVTKSVIAWVLIQASWFIMAVLIDISSIATAAISSFPTHFIDNNALEKQSISDEIAKNIQANLYKLDSEGKLSIEPNPNSTETTINDLIEKITPKNDSVVWPLVYIWASTLKIQNAINNSTKAEPGKIVTTSVLQFLLIAIYFVTLLLLLIANIIRIWLLWVIIPISPILILMFVINKDLGKSWIVKNFNISVILNAIFKPVIFAWVLSLVLIFIVTMQRVMTTWNDKSFSIQWTTFSSSWTLASMEVDQLFKATINDTIFTDLSNTSKNIFSNIIIYFATIFLLRYLVKTAVTSWWWTIWDTMTKATWFVEDMAKTAPIIKWISTGAMLETWKSSIINIWKAAWINLNYNDSENFGKNKSDEEFKQFFESKYLSKKTIIKNEQWDILKEASKKKTFIKQSSDLFNSLDSGLTTNDFEKWETLLKTAFDNKQTWIEAFKNIEREDFKKNKERIGELYSVLNFKKTKDTKIENREQLKKAYTE